MSELGNVLQEAREQKQMSLEELQAITKIQKRYLKAIEEGNYSQLPGDFYARAFVKNYAEAVGLNSDELFDTYENELPINRQEISKIPPRSDRVQPSFSAKPSKFMNFLPTLLIIIVIVGIFLIVWEFEQHKGAQNNNATANNNTSQVKISNHLPKSSTNNISSQSGSNTSNKAKASQPSQSKNSTGQAVNQQKATQKKQSPSSQTLKLDKTSGTTSYYTLSNTKQFILDMKVTDPSQHSWIQVGQNSSSGKHFVFRNLTKANPVHVDLSKEKLVYIKVGLVSATAMTINGQKFKFPSNSTPQTLYITFKSS